jgi:3-oxoacyl-[acyl-carrier protein] reductase
MKRLENKIAIITGAADGLGKAGATMFASEGATVIIWDVNIEKGNETANEIENDGGKAEFQKVDTSKMEEVKNAVNEIITKYSKIDILINNAGITRDATIKKMSVEQWNQVVAVNLTGVFNCISAVHPIMVENKFGRIINTSSVVGLYGNFGQTNYAATKAGVIGMTKTLAKELGRKGITVNAVAPGFIATEMVSAMPENVIDMMKAKVPVGRLGDPKEIAAAYLYLASDEAAYLNGTVLSVDGGITL